MRNGNILLNCIIYYFIFNIIGAPFVFGYLYLYERFGLKEIELVKSVTLCMFLVWYAVLFILTYLSARISTNEGEGIEDAISGACNELFMYIKISFNFKR